MTTDAEALAAQVAAHWEAHEREHEALAVSTQARLTAERERVDLARSAQERLDLAHRDAHNREHHLTDAALAKAERASEARFASVNEFREQLRDQARGFATNERLDALQGASLERYGSLQKDMDRRFAEQASLIAALQTTDAVAGGKTKGQALVIAAIITTVSVAATLLGAVILVANFVSAG